jgi:hypothetical protein
MGLGVPCLPPSGLSFRAILLGAASSALGRAPSGSGAARATGGTATTSALGAFGAGTPRAGDASTHAALLRGPEGGPGGEAEGAEGAEAPPPLDDDEPSLDRSRDRRHNAASPDASPFAPASVAPPPPSIVLAPLTGPAAEGASRLRASSSLEELLPTLVRRIAWSGDRHKGSVRMEIGSGELDGATLVIHADGARVRVEMSVPPGVDAHTWQERLRGRLASRGIDADAVEVT